MNIKLGIIQILKKDLTIENLSFGDEISVTLINFDKYNSIKIIPFFENIKKKELSILINIFNSIHVNIRLDDLLGKLHIVMLKFLIDKKTKQVLVVNDIGLTPNSINFLIQNFEKLIEGFENKSIIIYTN